ncbi:MAG: cytochrome c-type biogenesis protein CcmH [Microbacteriaceae bacterium]|nr:cytochrome c-type biogenesis protein CcmH [Burkholderiaceae bacterium]
MPDRATPAGRLVAGARIAGGVQWLVLLAALVWGLAWPLTCRAGEAPSVAANPALEARMMVLAAELRCLVCQNQSIADSHAGLAEDLRQQIRELLAKGQSERQILDYMTERYGDFVLYRPPVKASTALLWGGPALLMVGALGALFVVLRRRQRLGADAFDPDTPDDEPPR